MPVAEMNALAAVRQSISSQNVTALTGYTQMLNV
jgi:hypothetical protein